MVKRVLATMLFLFLPALLPAQLSPNRGGRSVVMATHGMVAASHPLAAQVGLDILKKGGNAIDAAIAVNAALGVMEPMMCGVGGDLYALVWDAKTKKLYGLNGSGRSPYKATLALFKEKGVKEIQSPLNWSVPGCVDAWEELRKRFGTMSFPQLLEPSIRYAEEGVPVPESIAWFWQWQPPEGEAQPPHPDFAKTFLPNGKAPQTGDVFKNPYLAGTYRTIAEGGRDAFYKGRIAQEIVAFSDQVGGLFTLKDFADHTSSWVEPVSTNYRGYDVWEIPPPGQGISVLAMLNILEGYDLGKMGRESADFWHLLIEAKKLAYADRARFYADPEFSQVPTAELISKSYAESQRKRVDMKRAAVEVEPGAPELGNHTTYFCVVDKDRNCVSLIQSVADLFGSKLVPGNLGFALHDRGAAFSLDPSHANHLEPHKRPFHTIIPAMVTKGSKPWLVFGVMGGWRQPQDQVQVLCNLIDFGMNVQEAGEVPRMEHLLTAASWEMSRRRQRSATVVAVESRFPAPLLQELTRRGHEFIFIPFSEGGYQGILINPITGVLQGGSEARRDGAAVGY